MKRILYNKAVYGDAEKKAVAKSLDNNWLAAGENVAEFEKRIAKLFGKKYGLATNSGSSANLLALTAFGLPKGSEVITPACTFATTVAPIIQCGLVPVFVDCIVGRYVIDDVLVEEMITDRTKAIVVPQLIGGVANMEKIRQIADKYSLLVLDDSCDTLAPIYKNDPLARFSDITTTSFYGSHIITTMGTGGMVMTDDENILKTLQSLVNWGRVGSDNEDFRERFDYLIDDIPYDSKFIYSNIGFNMKMTEGQGAFGLAQLDKLNNFRIKRHINYMLLKDFFEDYRDWFYLPDLMPEAYTTWLAFPLTIKAHAPFKRYDILKFLDSHDIQVRILFSGNITRHPAYKSVLYRNSKLDNSDIIMRSGFLVGLHQGLDEADIDYMKQTFKEFLSKW